MKRFSVCDVDGRIVDETKAETVEKACEKMGYFDCNHQGDGTSVCWVGNEAFSVAEDE